MLLLANLLVIGVLGVTTVGSLVVAGLATRKAERASCRCHRARRIRAGRASLPHADGVKHYLAPFSTK
jgi:hypothetical protein